MPAPTARSKVVLAVPIGPDDIVARFAGYADEVVCLRTPAFFFAVGQGYRHFTQTSDDEVIALLDRARDGFAEAASAGAVDPPLRDEEVTVAAGPVTVAGHLTIPEHPTGIVVFAHGSGSSRHSPRNRYVAEVLNRAGLATLLFDLLTPAEERNRANVFDIELLAGRLVDVTRWLASQPDTASLPVGYFGASTGAGAALVAATDPRVKVGAVVSRGGRPDLAGRSLANVVAPTLLIVGGRDEVVLELNRRAQAAIPGQVRTHHSSRRHAPVRRTGHARTGSEAGVRLVRRPLEPRCRTPVDRAKDHGGQGIRASLTTSHQAGLARKVARSSRWARRRVTTVSLATTRGGRSECEPSTTNTYRS